MSEERQGVTEVTMSQQAAKPGRFLGSLKDALAAASRDDTQRGAAPAAAEPTTQLAPKADAPKPARSSRAGEGRGGARRQRLPVPA